MANTQEDRLALEELYNEAINTGTFDEAQRSDLNMMAQEIGTTEENFKSNRKARNEEAAEELARLLPKLEESATHGNARDNWRHNKSAN